MVHAGIDNQAYRAVHVEDVEAIKVVRIIDKACFQPQERSIFSPPLRVRSEVSVLPKLREGFVLRLQVELKVVPGNQFVQGKRLVVDQRALFEVGSVEAVVACGIGWGRHLAS